MPRVAPDWSLDARLEASMDTLFDIIVGETGGLVLIEDYALEISEEARVETCRINPSTTARWVFALRCVLLAFL